MRQGEPLPGPTMAKLTRACAHAQSGTGWTPLSGTGCARRRMWISEDGPLTVLAPDLSEDVRDLLQARIGRDGLDERRHEVLVLLGGRAAYGVEGGLGLLRVAALAQARELLLLGAADLLVVDAKELR